MTSKRIGIYVVLTGLTLVLLGFVFVLCAIWVTDVELSNNFKDTAGAVIVPGVIALAVGGMMQLD